MAVHPLASYIGAFVMATFLNLFLFGVNWQQTLAYFEKLSVKERPVYVWTVSRLRERGQRARGGG